MNETGCEGDAPTVQVGDVVTTTTTLTSMPVGSIVEPVSDRIACVAYRATSRHWTLTGHGYRLTSTELRRQFAVGWIVLRIGERRK